MTSDFSNELRQLAKVKYSAALLLGGATYGCLGVYIALLAIAMWSQRLSTGSLSSHSQKRIKWVLWVTATLIIIHHLSITFLIVEQVCEAGRLDGDPYYMDEGQGCLVASISFIVTPTFNTFTPPLIVLLSDGILAWRVYVIWDRRRWLKYALAVILFLNCVLGFTTAVFMSVHPSSLGTAVPLYQTWLWLSLVLNSAMTFSVLIRIRQVGNLSWRDLNRYATVVRALVESAIVSWLAILLCAIIWNQHEPDCEDWSCLPAVFNVESLDDNKARFALSELSALPILLGISQVLIVARVNISKLDVTRDLNNAISIIADHWDSPPEVANDIALEILPPRQHPSDLNQRVIHTGC